jgi:hypothetical protein
MVLQARSRSQSCENGAISLVMCLSVRMEQFGWHWRDFQEILYLGIFRKFAENIKM